jgi:23S rRNA pseudouridine1911/1915/1917 synthase
LVVFAKTSKALARLNEMFRNGEVHKTYWALSRNLPSQPEGELKGYIRTIEKTNKSLYSLQPRDGYKEARLRYRLLGSSDRYHLIEVELLTGRKHQIRVQLSAMGCPIKGDLKYGDKRSNPDGSISLMARHIEFVHPVSKQQISLTAPVPNDPLWQAAEQIATNS